MNARLIPPEADYFMGRLLVDAVMCRDPSIQQAAQLVNAKHQPVSFGVTTLLKPNYAPKKADFRWDADNRAINVIPADVAAIRQALKRFVPGSTSTDPLYGMHLYCTCPPSLTGLQEGLTYGLKDVIYGPLRPDDFNEQQWKQTLKFAEMQEMKVLEYVGNLNWLRDRIAILMPLF